MNPDRHELDSLAWFTRLWAVAAVFHLVSNRGYFASPFAVPVLVVAGFVGYRPAAKYALPSLALAQLLDLWYWMPATSNHWLFTGMVNLGLLLGTARYGGQADRRREFFADTSAMIRVATVLFYFFVTLHKLNYDFLRPDVGAAAVLYRAHAAVWPFLPQGPAMDAAAIYGTLVVEGGIGLLLAIPATRGIGILIGALFHLVLSYNPVQHYYNFSAMIFAAYFMFAPQRITLVLNSWVDKYGRRLLRVVAAAAAVALVVAPVLWVRRSVNGWYGAPLYDAAMYSIWTAYAVGLIGAFIAATAMPREELPAPTNRLAFGLVVALVIFNGFNPYLGLKVDTCWEMYSNLRVEGANNHLFMPLIKLLPHQDQLIEIVDTDDPEIRIVAKPGRLVPLFELRKACGTASPDAQVTYRRAGKVIHVPRVGDDPTLNPPGYLVSKFLRYRPLGEGGAGAMH